MNLTESLQKKEQLRQHDWETEDYFHPIRLKWRAQMVRHLFHLFPEDHILEIGSGACQWARKISAVNKNLNPICAAIFNKNLFDSINNNELPENIEPILLDAFPGSLNGRQFDFIVGYHLLTDENSAELLSELKNLLKPGGQILLFDPNSWNAYYRLRKAFSILLLPFKQKTKDHSLRMGYHANNRLDLFTMFSEVGFVKIKILPYDFIFPPMPKFLLWPMKNLSLIFENLPYFRNFAGSLFSWAQKPAEEGWERPVSNLVQHDCFKGKLSIVIPSQNEELNIPPLVENLKACYGEYIREIIIVDDNSQDTTATITRRLSEEDSRIRLLQRTMPSGVGRALRDGFASAEGDFILTMDCDFLHILPEFTGLFDSVANGADVAIGSRFSRESVLLNYPFTKILANRSFHLVANLLLGKHFRDVTNNLKLIRKEVLKNLVLEADDFAANAETGLQPILLGYDVREVPISWINRSVNMGFSSFNLFNTGPNYFIVLFRLVFRKWFNIDIVQHPPTKHSLEN